MRITALKDRDGRKLHLANVLERNWTSSVFVFSIGAYGDCRILVCANHVEDALEELGEFIRDMKWDGYFTDPDYEDACAQLGVDYAAFKAGTLDDDTVCKVAELAETDLTYTEAGYLASWQWWVDEITDEDILARIDAVHAMEAR